MKKITSYLVVLFIATTILSSFKKNEQSIQTEPSEFELLVKYLEENGNFINSDLAPAIILASEIKDNVKNDKYLVLDIRSESWFEYGHIKNAKNAVGPELLNYFENEIDPSNFDKITIVCYSGQSAAYYASLLRIAGYNNVYSLKWGMSSWADEFAQNIWVKNSTNTYADQLETTVNTMPEKGDIPIIETGKIEGKEILKERIKEAFAKPYKEYIVKAETVFENPSDYFIVNYMDEEKYNFGHIPGAVQYQPKTLATSTNLNTLPTNKKVLVNCLTGQNAAYTVAYLNVLGYDVANLGYGSNSYMNTVLTEKGWEGFNSEEIQNYPVVE
ncbi:rhodanese-related sulfurtransferase [Lutibacter oceani]|uniref:Rhodanese-related sulfurtransferase n=1 Tax=Lutibacter oceani TaxID=1853311 RepID=A0A3D9RQH6_9FLAO|nr:rhodanese-like domain-containing protein [Lutibacter oceani]REE82179.1 rhodanese-related sulfurtransferase [Lutibacter oceani]